jgi:hypothetical protein
MIPMQSKKEVYNVMSQVHADKRRRRRKGESDLNNDQLLNLVALTALHPIPRRVRQRAADSPHNGDGGLEGT